MNFYRQCNQQAEAIGSCDAILRVWRTWPVVLEAPRDAPLEAEDSRVRIVCLDTEFPEYRGGGFHQFCTLRQGEMRKVLYLVTGIYRITRLGPDGGENGGQVVDVRDRLVKVTLR